MQFFPPPCILHPAEEVRLELDRRWGSKNWNDGATGPRKKFDDIFSHVDTIHQRDRRTDRHRPTAKTALTHGIAW